MASIVRSKQISCWCGAIEHRRFFDGPWFVGSDIKVGRVQLVRCSACGTIRTYEIVDVAHTSGDHTGGHFCSSEPRSWDRVNAGVISRFIKDGIRLLDVGCNTGQLMSLLELQQCVVEGIDTNADAVRIANERGLRVRTGILADQPGNGKFDAVVMSHLLEHLKDPLATLAETRRLTKVGGLLFLFVPNIASARARAKIQTWSPLMPVDHIWHFAPSTLFDLVVQSGGWKPIWYRSTALNDASPHRWARPLHFIARWLDFGEQVALVAMKTT